MVAGAMGVGKTTFCKRYASEHKYLYMKCQLDSEKEINNFNSKDNVIIDGGLFKPKDVSYGMTAANITIPYEMWGLFAPPKVVLERFKQKSKNPDYSEEKVMFVQSKLINIVDRAIWNI